LPPMKERLGLETGFILLVPVIIIVIGIIFLISQLQEKSKDPRQEFLKKLKEKEQKLNDKEEKLKKLEENLRYRV